MSITSAPPPPLHTSSPPPPVQLGKRTRSSLLRRTGRAHSPRYKWGVLGIGFAAQAGFSIAFQGIPVTGSVMRTAYHLSTGELGFVLSFMSLGIAASDVVWGILTDRVGERKVLITGLFGVTIALAACAVFLSPHGSVVPPVAALSAGLLIAGVLGGSVNGASGRAIMAWFKKSERGFAISVRVTAVPAGGAIGAVALPLLALHAGFGTMFAVLTGISLIVAVAVYLWLDEPPLQPLSGPAGKNVVTTPNPLKVMKVWRIAVASGLLNFPQFIVLTFGSVFLHDVKHVGFGVIAIVVGLVQAGGAVGRVWGGRWTDKRGGRLRRTVVKVQAAVVAVGFALIAVLAHGPASVLVVLITVAGMIACGWHGVAYAEIAEIAGLERSGTALGLENTMVFGGAFLTPILIPPVLSLTGSWGVTLLLLGALPAVLALVLIPREEKALAS